MTAWPGGHGARGTAPRVAAARGQQSLAVHATPLARERTYEPAWMIERIRLDGRFEALRSDPSFARLLAPYHEKRR